MPTTETIKQERMHIRLDTVSKQKLEKAATQRVSVLLMGVRLVSSSGI